MPAAHPQPDSYPNDIRYVCLSDLHLGEEDSILTPLKAGSYDMDPFVPGRVLTQLVTCLRRLLAQNTGTAKPVLLLNGDVLELAFGNVSEAFMLFERLIELVMQPGQELFDKILYIPGNHDHHIWELAREAQYVNTILGRHHEEGLPAPRHVTPLFPDAAVPSYLLNQIAGHVHQDIEPGGAHTHVLVMYPNLALLSPDHDRCVLFHHGHYVEPLYHFFSTGRRWLFPDRPSPQTVNQLEGENFAWIDFVWSLLGRSGGAGADVQTLFKMLRYPSQVDRYSDDLARRVAATSNIPFVPGDFLERVALGRLFAWIGGKLSGERCHLDEVCTAATLHGLEQYLFGQTYQQLRDEVGHIPADLSFVFGHTHKPFETVLADPSGTGQVRIYNTGGWPIDSPDPSPAVGASILFLNQALDVTSLRVYNDGPEGGDIAFQVRHPEGEPPSEGFGAEIERRIGQHDPAETAPGTAWQELAAGIREAILRRRRHHEEGMRA